MDIALPKPKDRAAEPLNVEAVYETTCDFVWRTLQRMGVPDRDLEDVQQEVYLVVHRRLGSYDRRCKLTTWLFGVCERVASDHRRSAYQRRERLVAPPSPPRVDETPEDQLTQQRALREAESLLLGLTPNKRATFVLFELERFTCEEIADMTGVPIGTVHSRLNSARKDVYKAIERLRRRQSGRADE